MNSSTLKTNPEKVKAWRERSRKKLKATPLRKIGKVGKANLEANRRIKKLNLPQRCEMQLDGCLGSMFLTVAHRHKRSHYRGDPKLLSDWKEVVTACVNCHGITEHNRELNDEVFNNLRP